jgi:hypothetical protein
LIRFDFERISTMPEQPPPFVVVDKRKFTAEGEIREGFVEPEPEAPRAAPEPEFSSAKIVEMPPRAPETTAAADDLAGEDMAGSLSPLERTGYDVDGDGSEYDQGEFSQSELDAAGEPRSAAETAEQHAAYRQSAQAIDAMLQQANPGMETPGAVSFQHVVQSFYLSAIMAMGAGTEPGQKPRIDILGARQSIDMLAVIEEKTRGNLSQEEQQLIQGITFELRMMFLELTNAISKQAQAPAATKPGAAMPGGGVLR